jgi:hypothetical protein
VAWAIKADEKWRAAARPKNMSFDFIMSLLRVEV